MGTPGIGGTATGKASGGNGGGWRSTGKPGIVGGCGTVGSVGMPGMDGRADANERGGTGGTAKPEGVGSGGNVGSVGIPGMGGNVTGRCSVVCGRLQGTGYAAVTLVAATVGESTGTGAVIEPGASKFTCAMSCPSSTAFTVA